MADHATVATCDQSYDTQRRTSKRCNNLHVLTDRLDSSAHAAKQPPKQLSNRQHQDLKANVVARVANEKEHEMQKAARHA